MVGEPPPALYLPAPMRQHAQVPPSAATAAAARPAAFLWAKVGDSSSDSLVDYMQMWNWVVIRMTSSSTHVTPI